MNPKRMDLEHFPIFPSSHLALFLFLMICCSSAPVLACPGCKEALFDPSQLPQKLATAKAYAVSIGLMLAVPALLIAGLATLLVRSSRPRRIR